MQIILQLLFHTLVNFRLDNEPYLRSLGVTYVEINPPSRQDG